MFGRVVWLLRLILLWHTQSTHFWAPECVCNVGGLYRYGMYRFVWTLNVKVVVIIKIVTASGILQFSFPSFVSVCMFGFIRIATFDTIELLWLLSWLWDSVEVRCGHKKKEDIGTGQSQRKYVIKTNLAFISFCFYPFFRFHFPLEHVYIRCYFDRKVNEFSAIACQSKIVAGNRACVLTSSPHFRFIQFGITILLLRQSTTTTKEELWWGWGDGGREKNALFFYANARFNFWKL